MLSVGDINCLLAYPGSKRFPRHYDALCIFHEEQSDIDNYLKDLITRYEDAPLKVFLGKKKFEKAQKHKAMAFAHQEVAEAINHLNSEFKSLGEVMRKVFDSFDLDKSGSININELKTLSKELSGKTMDQSELE